MEHLIRFPGAMERCCGFTIPENGVFYVFYFEFDLVRFDIAAGTAANVEEDWTFDGPNQTITFGGSTRSFVGVWGGRPLLSRDGLGELSLSTSRVRLRAADGGEREWQFENFSGDWENVTFDSAAPAFLFGAPYDFDFRYVELG